MDSCSSAVSGEQGEGGEDETAVLRFALVYGPFLRDHSDTKLSEAVDKLRTAPVAPATVAAAPVAPKEVTGTVTPAVEAASVAAAPVAA